MWYWTHWDCSRSIGWAGSTGWGSSRPALLSHSVAQHLPWGTHCAMGSSTWHMWIKKFPVFIHTYLILVDSVFWYQLPWLHLSSNESSVLLKQHFDHSFNLFAFYFCFHHISSKKKQAKQNKPYIALEKGYNWLVVYTPCLSPSLVCP